MKTRLRWMIAVVAVGSLTAASALAASPKPGALYEGTGKDFMNNAPKWTNEATGKISFKTSAKGTAVVGFRPRSVSCSGRGVAGGGEGRWWLLV